MTKSRRINQPRRYWTAEEDSLLALLYPDCHAEDVAALMGLMRYQVYNRVHSLRLHKSAEWYASITAGRIQRGKQHPSMVATRFKPGLMPWNKGIHYKAGGRSAETRFKPGSRPQTWRPIGSYRTMGGYLQRKETDTGYPPRDWVPVHRTVWADANGPMPARHVVIFKPGRYTVELQKIAADGLECISRGELAKRNHPRNKSPELAKLVQLKGAITRQVNRINKEAAEARKQTAP